MEHQSHPVARQPAVRRVVVQHQAVAVGQANDEFAGRHRDDGAGEEVAKQRLNVRMAQQRERAKRQSRPVPASGA